MSHTPTPVILDYTNHRGERSMRRVIPKAVMFATTEYHPEPQWIMRAVDLDKNAERHFAMEDIHGMKF